MWILTTESPRSGVGPTVCRRVSSRTLHQRRFASRRPHTGIENTFNCCEPGCDCLGLELRLGEGFCLVMYEDGHFGVLELMERLKSEEHRGANIDDAYSGSLIDWKEPETRVDGEILASISRWGLNTVNMTSLGAYTGMWMAHAHAVSRGIFPPLQEINPLQAGPSARVRKHLKNRQRTR